MIDRIGQVWAWNGYDRYGSVAFFFGGSTEAGSHRVIDMFDGIVTLWYEDELFEYERDRSFERLL